MTPSRKKVETDRAKFIAFLTERGAQILTSANEWELVRFRCQAGVAIIYGNSKGGTTFTGEAIKAWAAFKGNHSWSAGTSTKRKKINSVLVQTLIQRDGKNCFYCFGSTTDTDRTVEHLLSVLHGGTYHVANLVLAHCRCNQKAGHLSVMEKVRIRERSRARA